jgi:hypothetical protein
VVEAQEIVIEVPLLAEIALPAEKAETPHPVQPAALRPEVQGSATEAALGIPPDTVAPIGRTQRILGLTAGGIGIAAALAGLGVGWSATSTWDDAFESGQCERDTKICTPDGQKQTELARDRANLSNALAGTGIALAATGIVLYLTAPNAQDSTRSAHWVPIAKPDALGVAIVRSF